MVNSSSLIVLSKKEITVCLILLTLSIVLVGGSRLLRLQDPAAISSENPQQIYLEETTTLEELAPLLSEKDVVSSEEELMWAGKVMGWKNFKKGHYRIDEGRSYDEFLSDLAKGVQDPIPLTILPGTTEDGLIRYISQRMEFDSTEFKEALKDEELMEELNVDQEDIFSRMLPNTYSIYWTASPRALIKRMVSEFNRTVVEPHKDRLAEVKLDLDEIVTMASIIEWEAQLGDEKKRISGLYWNRLNNGMRLQADPTVNYVVGERRRLLYEDYRIDHPYNTYVNDGLPPGPITNPDLSSIEAALYPEKHDYFYMVASPEGEHVFSETFQEHREKSRKWREWLQEQYRIKREIERKESQGPQGD